MKKLIGSRSSLITCTAIFFAILTVSNSCTKPMDNMSGSTTGSGTGVKGGSGGPGTNEVWILGTAYSPSTITVTAGTTITWTNKDVVAHTATSDTGLFDSGSISNNGTYSHMFSTAGTFPYKCTFHTSMTATVIVN